jgi:hypothetical protein
MNFYLEDSNQNIFIQINIITTLLYVTTSILENKFSKFIN